MDDPKVAGMYSASTALIASPPKAGRSVPGVRTTTLCPIDSFGISPTLFNVSFTGSPTFTRKRFLSNFIWSFASRVRSLLTSTASKPGISTAGASSVAGVSVDSADDSSFVWLLPPQAAKKIAPITRGIKNNRFILIAINLFICGSKVVEFKK